MLKQIEGSHAMGFVKAPVADWPVGEHDVPIRGRALGRRC